jgi:hypothetical protein
MTLGDRASWLLDTLKSAGCLQGYRSQFQQSLHACSRWEAALSSSEMAAKNRLESGWIERAP